MTAGYLRNRRVTPGVGILSASAQPPQPRVARPAPRRPAGDRGVHGDLHPGAGRRRSSGRDAQPRLQRVAHLRGDLPRAVPGGTPRDPLRAAQRRPLPVPAGGRAGERGDRDGVPDQPHAGAPAGAVDGGGAGAVRGHDSHAAPHGGQRAGALPLHDRRRGYRYDGATARARDRPGSQRGLPQRARGQHLLPAGGAGEDRAGDLSRQLPARQPPDPRHRGPARARGDAASDEAVRADARGVGRGDGDAAADTRARHLADVLRRLPRAVVRRHGPPLVPAGRLRAVRRSAPGSS